MRLLLTLCLVLATAVGGQNASAVTNVTMSAVPSAVQVVFEQTVVVEAANASRARLELVGAAVPGCLLGRNETTGNDTAEVWARALPLPAPPASAVFRCASLSHENVELRASAPGFGNSSQWVGVEQGSLAVTGWNESLAWVPHGEAVAVELAVAPVAPDSGSLFLAAHGGNGSCGVSSSSDGPFASRLEAGADGGSYYVLCAYAATEPARLEAFQLPQLVLANWTSPWFRPGKRPEPPAAGVAVSSRPLGVAVSWAGFQLFGLPALGFELEGLNQSWAFLNDTALLLDGLQGGVVLQFRARVRTAVGYSAWAYGSGAATAGSLRVLSKNGASDVPALVGHGERVHQYTVVLEPEGDQYRSQSAAVLLNATNGAPCGFASSANATQYNATGSFRLAANATELGFFFKCSDASGELHAIAAFASPLYASGNSSLFQIGYLPSFPTNVTATPRLGSANVNWTEPTGYGLPILDYLVTSTFANKTTTVDAQRHDTVFKKLHGDVDHYFFVTARSAVGSGPPSDRTTRIVPSTFTPDAVEISTADVGYGSVTVTWEAAEDNGLPVTGYRVSTLDDCVVLTNGLGPDERNFTYEVVDGETNTFIVTAVNDNGVGPSASVEVVSTGPPHDFVVTGTPFGSAGGVLVEWEEPYDGGSALTRYQVFLDGVLMETFNDVTASRESILLVSDDTQLHDVHVMAYNPMGAINSSLVTVDVASAPLQRARSFSFADTDMDYEELGGTITVNSPDDESTISHYDAYFATSSGVAITDDVALIGSVEASDESKEYIEVPENTRRPSSASRILVLSRYYSQSMAAGRTASISDRYVPYHPPGAVAFADTEDAVNVAGEATVARPYTSSSITDFSLYWGSAELERVEAVAEVEVGGTSVAFEIADNTSIPAGATHLLAYSANSYGEADVAVSALRVDDFLCYKAPDCAELNREACTSTDHTCGECLAGFVGTDGASNDECISPPMFFANITWNNSAGVDLVVDDGHSRLDIFADASLTLPAGELTHWTAQTDTDGFSLDLVFLDSKMEVVVEAITNARKVEAFVSSYREHRTTYRLISSNDEVLDETTCWIVVIIT